VSRLNTLPDPERYELLDGLYVTRDFLLRAGSAWEDAPGESRLPLLLAAHRIERLLIRTQHPLKLDTVRTVGKGVRSMDTLGAAPRGEALAAAGLLLMNCNTDIVPLMVENRTICAYIDSHADLCLRI
jgi:hypothetical protein